MPKLEPARWRSLAHHLGRRQRGHARYVARLLSGRFEVEAVADGQAALEAALADPPDLVLYRRDDARLDGYGLLRELRADPLRRSARHPRSPPGPARRTGSKARRPGADDYLVKPFSARELVARVEAHASMARMRREANVALRHRTQQFETLVNQAPLGVYLVDADFRIRTVNPVALPVFGDIPGGVVGRDFDEIIHILWQKEYADEVVEIFRRTLRPASPTSRRSALKSGAICGLTEYYEWRADRIVLPDGRYGVVCYFRDIAAQVQARRTQRLLVDELNHRVKNTLASVQAIVQHTLRRTKDPAEFAASFGGRIQSMARVHALLSTAVWKGADLRDVIRDQLLLGPVDETRLTARGPAVRLEPQMALHLALMLHELGTNSIKYGALSVPHGLVSINWTVDDSLLRLQWMERGGPLVSAPVRRGFGTTLIQQSAQGEGGEAHMSCAAEGITWAITLPLQPQPESHADVRKSAVDLIDARPALVAEATLRGDAPSLLGKRFMIVEDEPLVMMDLVAGLQEGGAEVAGKAGTEADALQIIDSTPLDGALLDGNLRGQPVDRIAAALTRRQIPFLFVTGYGRQSLPLGFGHAPILGKPFMKKQLLDAAGQLVERPSKVVQLQR